MAELDPTKVYFTKYTNERLGNAFIGENSGKTVTEALSNTDETISVVSGTVTSHTEDSTVHVTAQDKTLWNSKLSPSDIQSLFGWANYNQSTKRINFYTDSSSETVLCYIDASDFIKDGMVENVQIKNVQISGQSVSCLVISFNTDSGKENINIPLSDLFDPTNYYNKTEINAKLGTGITVSSVTEVIESDERVFSEAINDLNTKKADTSAVTEAISSAVSYKANISDLTGYTTTGTTSILSGNVNTHTGNSTIHLTSTEKTNVGALATNIAAISGVTSTKVSNWDGAASKAHTHSNKTAIDSITGSVGTMAYQNTGSYSSATQVNSALAGKSNTGHGHSISDVANLQSSLDGKSGTGHTHGISIATDSGTNQLTLAANTKYKITAGGQSYIFTTPADTNNWRPLGTGANDACAGNDSRLSNARTPTAHNQASNTITTMAGYSKPSATSAIATGDTLNAAVGKLEKALDGKQPSGNYLTSHQSVTLASGTNNGTLKITTAAGTTDNVAVKGINSMAYQATGSYSSATQVNSALAGKAASNHTHGISIATDSGTNQLTLAANTKYKITAGGQSYIFTTPADTNNWRPITNTYTGSDQSTSVSQYGTNALYNALVNGYASSAGNADTVDSEHASAFAHIGAHNNLTAQGNEFTFASNAFSGAMWINYRTAGGANGNITQYNFGNGKGGSLASITSGTFNGNCTGSAGSVAWTNVSGRPTNLNQFTNGPGYITGINKTMVVNALGYTPPTTDTNTWRTVQCNGTSIGNNTLNLKPGTNVSLSNSNGTITITSTDTNTWRPLGTGANDACAGNDSRLSNARPASDVYSWAKASSKPSYSIGEISGIQVLNGTLTTVSYTNGDGATRWASYVSMSETEARKVISFQYMVTNQGGGFDGNQGCVFFSKNGWGYAKSYTEGNLTITNAWFHLWGAGNPGTVYYNLIKRT